MKMGLTVRSRGKGRQRFDTPSPLSISRPCAKRGPSGLAGEPFSLLTTPRPDFTSSPFHLIFHLPRRPAAEASPRARMTLAPRGEGEDPSRARITTTGRRRPFEREATGSTSPRPRYGPSARGNSGEQTRLALPAIEHREGTREIRGVPRSGVRGHRYALTSCRPGRDHRQGCSRQAEQLAP